MIISFVVAASTNNAIGKNNQLLWHLPNDLKFFKNITWAMPVAMGRKTFEALGSKPLNGRFNIIITRQAELPAEGVTIVHTIEDAVSVAEANDYKELMITGGSEIYKQAMSMADKIYLTRVHANFEDADAYFPSIDEAEWKLISNKDFATDEKHAYAYSFQLWERK